MSNPNAGSRQEQEESLARQLQDLGAGVPGGHGGVLRSGGSSEFVLQALSNPGERVSLYVAAADPKHGGEITEPVYESYRPQRRALSSDAAACNASFIAVVVTFDFAAPSCSSRVASACSASSSSSDRSSNHLITRMSWRLTM